MQRNTSRPRRVITLLVFLLSIGRQSSGYSVLTHQAIIDSAWDDSIAPMLHRRFAQATAEQIESAHAYVYGGAIIQDIGYFPFGSRFFTDLAHYVRSGDFVTALIEESQDLQEYAFALGALAHYCADTVGHAVGVNRAVPLVYPKLAARYGSEVTYEQDPEAHLKTEFGFDVLQVARGGYAPEAYHDFIGFQVSPHVLERGFARIYGLEAKEVFTDFDLAVGTYRRAVSTLLPEVTKIAWELNKGDLEKRTPGITRDRFVYDLSRPDYEKDFGTNYERPGFFAKVLAWLLLPVPKVGPWKALGFRPPPPEAERLFVESFNATLGRYRALLPAVRRSQLQLANDDLDTGKPSRARECELADETYAKLLRTLSKRGFENASPELRANLLSFYASAPTVPKDVARALEALRASPSAPASR